LGAKPLMLMCIVQGACVEVRRHEKSPEESGLSVFYMMLDK
jgi:hypothetical protein